jgi:septum formation protein
MKLILASTSPRRKDILALLGVPFEVIAPQFAERTAAHRRIEEEVIMFAARKAESVAKAHPQSIVIGSDTMISIGREKIGKPRDGADAKRILCALAGRVHRILTSVVIADRCGGPGLKIVEKVTVRMHRYSDADIDDYIAHNESLDKAGAYSIQGQGRALIQWIQGDYLAAVGLPLMPIADYLTKRGIKVRANVKKLYSNKVFPNWDFF